jgi:putative addiction module killer protein
LTKNIRFDILDEMPGASGKYIVREYVRLDGASPFRLWLDTLQIGVQARIQARVARFEAGNQGDSKPVGDGVLEARFHFGPGYRLYFAIDGRTVIILLCGGDKGSQRADVRRAKEFWKDYQERGNS